MALRLKRLLEGKDLPLKAYAKILGISYKTFYNKLSGESEFSISEFQKLKEILPEYDVLYLLETDASST